ncbi:hypothetical protein [Pedobacter sp. MW01-1-1]|uniref:hypothetical protein n=1 Tax=Pedobacter sp. MW01-1-1 TaxID=3383027 RepID=UPI003FEFD9F3
MKAVFCVVFFFFFGDAKAQLNLGVIRAHYLKAPYNKDICKKMIEELKRNAKEPIYLGYLGGFQTIYAKHLLNPFSKLKTFNQGRKNIDGAIIQASDSVELRYIRLSVQKNAPSFLGYSGMVNQDTDFLRRNKAELKKQGLIEKVETLLND